MCLSINPFYFGNWFMSSHVDLMNLFNEISLCIHIPCILSSQQGCSMLSYDVAIHIKALQ